MVEFGSGYSMPMDREYGQHNALRAEASPANNSTNDVKVGIGEFGISLGLGPVQNVPAIGAKLRAGIKTMELGFMGAGKGGGQGHTPEMYGQKQRQALSEMKTANRVDFTTHSSVGVWGLAGQDQQGNFSKSSKSMALSEIKRAIEFASDVAAGGPVVVHTGEFRRPIVDAEWNSEDEKWRGKFKMYDEEAERTSYHIVDTRTGHLIQEARKNRKVSKRVWNRYEEGTEEWDKYGGKAYTDDTGKKVQPGSYIDFQGNYVPIESRMPRFDKSKGTFMTKQMDWNDLQKEAEEMTGRAREVWKQWKSGDLTQKDFESTNWARFKEVKTESDIKIKPEEAYVISTLETNAANSRGWALHYGAGYENDVDKIRKMKKALEFYEKLESDLPEDEKWKLKVKMREGGMDMFVPEEEKMPSEWIKKELKQREQHLKQTQEASSSQCAQAAEAAETIRHVQSADTYALKESYDSYAQSGIVAMQQTDKLQKEGKLKKPLAIAMENLYPESFGAHPEELITIIQNRRERMQEMLVKRGMAEEEAKKKAETHITATLDTGHLNMWRKYWTGDPQKSLKENYEEFNKWMMEKVVKLSDSGVLGHIHLVDNYGYQDDHLAPGEGNTPVKLMIETLKSKGYKGEIIVEPGADYTTDVSGFHTVMKTWSLFGSPVYGAASGVGSSKRGWGEVGYGWFGQTQPPYFTFGGYSPSEEWTLWSGVQL